MTKIGQLIEWLENNLKPDELFKKLLALLTGPNSWIVLTFVMVGVVLGWLKVAQNAFWARRKLVVWLRSVAEGARSLPAGDKTYRTITTLGRILFQMAWIWSVYTVGNAVNNLAAYTAPGAIILWNEDGSLHAQVFQPMQWNNMTSTITIVGVGTLAAFYWKAVKWYGWANAVAKFAVWVLASPGLVCAGICSVLVLQGAFAGPWHSIYLTALTIALLYTIFCFIMPESVRRLMRTWPSAPQSPGTPNI